MITLKPIAVACCLMALFVTLFANGLLTEVWAQAGGSASSGGAVNTGGQVRAGAVGGGIVSASSPTAASQPNISQPATAPGIGTPPVPNTSSVGPQNPASLPGANPQAWPSGLQQPSPLGQSGGVGPVAPGSLETGGLGMDLSDDEERLTVRDIRPDGPAAQIGLQAGDQVISVGGREVSNMLQFDNTIRAQARRNAGNRVWRIPVEIRRNGQSETLYWTAQSLAVAGYTAFPGTNRTAGATNDDYRNEARGAVSNANELGQGRFSARHPAFLGVDLDSRFPNAAVIARVYPTCGSNT